MPTAAELGRADGTTALLKVGGAMLAVGVLCIGVVELALGGIHRHGPQGNTAWFLLICAGFLAPFGLVLFLLGVAKWQRNRRRAEN